MKPGGKKFRMLLSREDVRGNLKIWFVGTWQYVNINKFAKYFQTLKWCRPALSKMG
jgi:hypothetical protein